MVDIGDANVVMLTLMLLLNPKPTHGTDMVDMAMVDIGDANVVMLTLMLLLNPKPTHGTDMVDTGGANVETLTLMLSLSLKLSHTTMHTILIIPTITLVKDPLMPSLSHGMDIEDMVDTGVANVAPLKL